MQRLVVNHAHGSDTRNAINANFEYLFQGVSRMNQLSVEADLTLKEAQRINNINNDTNARLDNIIADSGTSSTEVVDARGGETVLSNRLSKIEGNVDGISEDLTDKAEKALVDTLRNSITYNHFGEIEYPQDFVHNIDFSIYRDVDGLMKHTFDIDDHLENWNATHLYVSEFGSGLRDGTEEDNPTNNLSTALTTAMNGSDSHYIIHIFSKYISKDYTHNSDFDGVIKKNIAIVSDVGESFIGNFQNDSSWNNEGSGVYSRNRSATTSVFDAKFKTAGGLPKKYESVNSVSECQNKKGSWYTDGSKVWVHRLDGSQPVNNEVMLALNNSRGYSFNLTDDVEFVMKDITSINPVGPDNLRVTSAGQTKGQLILHNVKLPDSGQNGLGTNGIKNTWLFDCISSDSRRDGFNYHNTISGDAFVFEYNSMAFNCGVNDSNENNNATTGHEGIYILRVGSKGWNTRGPVLADVGGCYSICYDCTMYDSIRSDHPTEKTAYQFAQSGGPAKAYMYNCGGGGKDTAFISSTGSFGKVYISNLRGDMTKIVNADYEFI